MRYTEWRCDEIYLRGLTAASFGTTIRPPFIIRTTTSSVIIMVMMAIMTMMTVVQPRFTRQPGTQGVNSALGFL